MESTGPVSAASRDPQFPPPAPGLPNRNANETANAGLQEDAWSPFGDDAESRPVQNHQPENENNMARQESSSPRPTTMIQGDYGNIELDQEELAKAFIETLRRVSRPKPTYSQAGPLSEQYIPPPPPPPPPLPRMPMHLTGTSVPGASQFAPVRPEGMSRHGYSISNASGLRMANDPFRNEYAASISSKSRTVYTNRQPTTPRSQRGFRPATFIAPSLPRKPSYLMDQKTGGYQASGSSHAGWPLEEDEESVDGDKDDVFMNSRDTSIESRHEYLVALARALLCYGAPTHRVEAYMSGAATCLGVPAKFLYMPDHFIISLDDDTTLKSEFRLVKGGGGDMGRFDDVHTVYKLVNRDAVSVDEAIYRLKMIERQKDLYSQWFLLLIYGFAAVGIGPFAYKARFIDLPISFAMGILLGVFQLKLVPKSPLYHMVFEISTAIIMSFLGRMFGSIRGANGEFIFCYSAITQSCINLILPGYWITNAGLELMNHQLVAGSTRMMHALVYFLFLSYGISMGSAFYGFIDADANSNPVCQQPMDRLWNLLFVPFFSVQVAILNRAKWRQIPVMVLITFLSYGATFVSVDLFNGSFTFANTIGGVVIGMLGNAYSRVGSRVETALGRAFRRRGPPENQTIVIYNAAASDAGGMMGMGGPPPPGSRDGLVEEARASAAAAAAAGARPGSGGGGGAAAGVALPSFALAAAAMVPAMIVQVPSGLAAVGAVLNGVTTADAIVRNATSGAAVGAPAGEIATIGMPVILNVVQIGISIGFGLSLAAMLTYPAVAKKRSGVMSW